MAFPFGQVREVKLVHLCHRLRFFQVIPKTIDAIQLVTRGVCEQMGDGYLVGYV